MKKALISFLFAATFIFGFSHASYAQGNLQFNQVILIELAASGSQAITVPAGKVWKIEAVSMGSSGSAPSIFLRNSGNFNVAHLGPAGSSTSAGYPFWLPEAYTGSFLNNQVARCTISIIEFNVVP